MFIKRTSYHLVLISGCLMVLLREVSCCGVECKNARDFMGHPENYHTNSSSTSHVGADFKPEDELDEISSILKLSHHNSDAQGATTQSEPHSRASTAKGNKIATIDKNKRDPFSPQMNLLKFGQQPLIHERIQANKRNRLISFMNNPRKLSLTSLLPVRSIRPSASAQNQTGTLNSSSTSNTKSAQNVSSQFSDSDRYNTINGPSSNYFNDADLFLNSGLHASPHQQQQQQQAMPFTETSRQLGGRFMGTPQTQLPPPPTSLFRPGFRGTINHDGTHLANWPSNQIADKLQQSSLGPNGNHLAQINGFDHHFLTNLGHNALSGHLLGGFHHSMMLPGNHNQDQFVADQSIENHQRIRLNKLNQFGTHPQDSLPLILASSNGLGPNGGAVLNSMPGLSVPATNLSQISNNQPGPTGSSQSEQKSTTPASGSPDGGNLLAPIALTSAAMALLNERAKNILSQLNQVAPNASRTNATNVRNNRQAGPQDAQDSRQIQPQHLSNVTNNGLGLASMIKSAAEVWATGNQLVQNVAQGNGLADAAQTIVFEHDGPTVTTVDLSGPQAQLQNPIGLPPEDEDEEVATFYSDNEEAEQEGGSQQMKQVAKVPRLYQMNHGGPSMKRHPKPPIQAAPHMIGADPHRPLRHPNFEHQMVLFPMRPPTNKADQSEFYEDSSGSNQNQNQNQGNSQDLALNDVDYGNENDQRQPNYPRQRRMKLQREKYPDSINAIKEQNDRRLNAGTSRDKMSSTSDDPIEKLIRELQELKSRNYNMPKESERKHKESQKSSSSDGYEDMTSSDGDDKEPEGDHEANSSEDDQLRVLRNKLMARLSSKYDKKKTSLSGGGSTSVSNTESIRIPLHALLLAALDRRMSPSESKSQSVSQQQDSASGGNLIQLDERNKKLILSGRRDFHDATTDLGSLFEGNQQLFEQLARASQRDRDQQQSDNSVDHMMKLPLNLQNVSQESLTPAGMLLIENLATMDELNQKKIGTNTQIGEGLDSFIPGLYTAATTQSPSLPSGRVQNQTSAPTTTTTSTSTTTERPSSTTSTTTTERPAELGPGFGNYGLPASRGRNMGPRGHGNHRDISPIDGNHASSVPMPVKGRRATQEEGDFNLERQVDEYANDKHDKSLEPNWMKTDVENQRPPQRSVDRDSVEFDDEFDEVSRQTRRRIVNPKQRKRNNGHRRPLNEGNFEANEQRFLDKMQRDTSDNVQDVDQTIRKIEQSIPDAESAKRGQTARRHRMRLKDKDYLDADDDNEENAPAMRPNRDDEDTGDEPSESRRVRTRENADPKKDPTAWQVNMVEDEVRRMEDEERRKRESKLARRRSNASDSSDDDDDQHRGGGDPDDGSESRFMVSTPSGSKT